MPAVKNIIGILYAGDLGFHLGMLLQEKGYRVLTTVAGRSSRTRQRAEEAHFEIVPSLAGVLTDTDVVFSLVPPAAAVAVAERCRTDCQSVPRAHTFVDLNSIAPDTARRIAGLLADNGMNFVDGAVHGMAGQLRTRGTLYLSGVTAESVAELFETSLRVKVLGDEPGQASAFKMMISGLNKGVVALVLEMALAARQAGFLDDLLTCYREAYPGIMAVVDRLLPTYPEHARRRGDELNEVAQTMRSLGMEPCLVDGARELTERVGRLNLENEHRSWSVAEVIESVFANNPLVIKPEAGIPGPLQPLTVAARSF